MSAPFTVTSFDRLRFDPKMMRDIAQSGDGRKLLEKLRVQALADREQFKRYADAQLAESDELLRRFKVALEGGAA